MKEKEFLSVSRDISWLSFNDRVLQEANDPSVPLLERLKFLGIVSSNRDEFFRVRIATLKRMIRLGKKGIQIIGEDPAKLLARIQEIIIVQQEEFDSSYQNLLRELELKGVFIVNEKQLKPDQVSFARQYFREQVLPTLVPILLDNVPDFPYLRDRSIYFLVIMHHKSGKDRYALVEIPTHILPRFIVIPKENKYIILIDDIIRYSLDDLFFSFEYENISAYTIKLTRDAELDIETDVTKSLIKKISESVKRRRKGQPVRLIYDEQMPETAVNYLMRRIKFAKGDQPIPAGRYHNFVDFISFPSLNRPELFLKPQPPLSHPDLLPKHSVLKVIKEKDILLSFPYQSYHHIIDVLREASMDPKVTSIDITLYRISQNSHIVNALINAIRNGKQVTVVVELQARFDEENNIKWTNRLNEEGAKVIYGVPGLKMHSKLFLIHRSEHGKDVLYAHIGTGNFNEVSSKIYCDHSLLTADKRITEEVESVFRFYNDNYKTGTYKHLLVSPFFARKKILQFIQTEIDHKKKGKEAWIFLKMNSLTDTELIKKLYEASNAGVKVRMIIRGICSLVPGHKKLSENIEIVSIVDKYLEHARVFIFANNGAPRYYLASFDWMNRNLDFRSEVGVPIYDAGLQKQLLNIMELQWSDNTKARVIDATQSNSYRKTNSKVKVRAQEAIYKYLAPPE